MNSIDSLLAAAEKSTSADLAEKPSDEENLSQSSEDEEEDRMIHLTCGFVRMLKQSGILEFRHVANELQCEREVVQDIASVFESCQLVKRVGINKIQWCAPFHVLRLPSELLPQTRIKQNEEDFVSIPQLENENQWLDSMLAKARVDVTQLATNGFVSVDDLKLAQHALVVSTNLLATCTSIQILPRELYIDSDRPLELFELSERELKRIKMDPSSTTTVEKSEETIGVAQLFPPAIRKDEHASTGAKIIGSHEGPTISATTCNDDENNQ